MLKKSMRIRFTCGATDGLGLDPDRPWFGRCNLPAGHAPGPMAWHLEMRRGRVWANWRGPMPGVRCGICGKDGCAH